jgi:hypothetical protein
MTLLVPWIVFPLVLCAIALGIGLGLRELADARIPGPALLPLGLAATTIVASLTTWSAMPAPLTVPVLVALAAGGLALGSRRSFRRFDPWAAICATAAFLAVGTPVLATGEATFAGYVKLDDTATFLALTDRTLEHGRDLEGLAPSSYEATLSVNLEHGYPTGALLPLGVGSRLVGTDPAWLFQPYLACLAATLALGLYCLLASFVRRRAWRATAAAVASQPALLYGFAMWGGVKELFAAAMLALVAVTVPLALDGRRSALVPAAGAAALVLGLSVGAVLWLVPAALALVLSRPRAGLLAAGCCAAFAAPAFAQAPEFFREANVASFREGDELGNLVERLHPAQVFGIWPSADFRTSPGELRLTYVLLTVTAAAAVVAMLIALRRRESTLLTYVAMCAGGAIAVSMLGSPWLQAKAFAVAGPAAVLLALAGAAHLAAGVRRIEGLLLFVVVAGGVVWSDGLAARDAALAPRDRLAELESIGRHFAGQGPALMTEYQPYGVRHFLRRLDAEGASELRRRPIPLRTGGLAAKGTSPPLDELVTDAVLVYRTLVLSRSARAGRPPAPYESVWRGRYYEVWRRPANVPRVLSHVPLGSDLRPVSPAPCPTVLATADVARRSGGVLAAAGAVDAPVYVVPSRARSLCGVRLDWLEALDF